jgi:hypothetical protein
VQADETGNPPEREGGLCELRRARVVRRTGETESMIEDKDIRTDTYTWGVRVGWKVRMTDLVTGRVLTREGEGEKSLSDAKREMREQLEQERQR